MTERKSFPGIAPACWEHPADKAALAAFASVPGASDLVRRLVGSTAERSYRLAALASAARVSADQFPGVHRLVAEACRVLDLSPLPEVFVRRGVEPDAYTIGVERPFIVLSSAALDFWDEAELLAVIGHEVGHILSGHAVYKTLLEMLLKAAGFLGGGPLAGVAFAAAKAALLEWDRKSELSADRAGLLACQDPGAAYRALMKTAGGSRHAEMDLNEFFRQARDYDAAAEGLDSLYKFLDLVGENHPFPAVRMTTLQEWERGGGYEAVLRGEYPRRAADGAPGADPSREARGSFEAAGAEYRREFAASQDPLAQAAGKVMDALGGVFEGIRGAASGFPRGGEGEPGGPSGSAGAEPRNGAGEGGQPRRVEDLLDELFGKKPR